jgi:DNA-binding CsgD family transcriptional regulator
LRNLYSLTKSETEIVKLISTGYEVSHIARILSIQERTISTHIYSINQKIKTRNKVEIARYALKTGLVMLDDVNFGTECESELIKSLPVDVWNRFYELSLRLTEKTK